MDQRDGPITNKRALYIYQCIIHFTDITIMAPEGGVQYRVSQSQFYGYRISQLWQKAVSKFQNFSYQISKIHFLNIKFHFLKIIFFQ